MAKSASKLEWCIVCIGKDSNWWVEETSDPIHWDPIDGLSILDPRQITHIIDSLYQLTDYGFQMNLVDRAFYKFRIDRDLGNKGIRLVRVNDSLVDPGEPLFALPDIIDDEKGPYADLLNQLIRMRVKMLNDLIDFDQNLTTEEIEEELREHQSQAYMEGNSVHVFDELAYILEYVPQGYELDDEEDDSHYDKDDSSSIDDEFPDLEEEDIEEDETMKWGDEDDEFSEDDNDKDNFDYDEESSDDFDDEDDAPKSKKSTASNKKKPKSSPKDKEKPSPKKKKK